MYIFSRKKTEVNEKRNTNEVLIERMIVLKSHAL